MVIVPLRLPAALGVNETEIVQLADAARLLPDVHVFEPIAKSAPVRVVAPRTSAALPVLVSVTLCAVAVLPIVVEPNVSWVGERVAPGAPAAAPVPVSDTEVLDGVALWAIVNVAFRAPVALGVKVTETLQLADAARLLPEVQLLLPIAKSAPAIDVAPSTSAAVPVLVSVTVCAAAVLPTVVEPNVSCVGDALAAGAPAAAPVPESVTLLLDGVAL